MDDNRGEYNNKSRARQLILFKGIRYKNITPTDIDFSIEYNDKFRILGDFKYGDVKIKDGQKLQLKRYIDDFLKAGKPSMAFIARHSVSDCTEDVIGAEAIIDEVYINGKWTPSTKSCTVKELCDWFIGSDNGL